MKIYIVLMRRWGSEASHSYIVSAHKKKEEAEYAGKVEEQDRAGKYHACILEIDLV